MVKNYRMDYLKLVDFVKEIFIKHGVNEENSLIISESLVDADLRNVISHGVMRACNYIDRITHGGTTPNPDIKIIHETPTTALLDGDNGLGSIVSEFAVKLAREKAEKNGISFITVRGSSHYGAAARWAIKLSGDDMIGMTGSNTEPLICITGGKSKGIGNNPFSCAFPTGSYGHICYDVACSVMAGGKMLAEYKLPGKNLPLGCFLDIEGNPTTDPNQAALMMPFGGHKGYGLAVVGEMFSSILSGGNFGYGIGSQYDSLDKPSHISHYYMALKIDTLRNLQDYKNDADKFVKYLHELPKSDDTKNIYFPGELERISKEDKIKNGVIVQSMVIEDLISIGKKAGLTEDSWSFLTEHPIE